MQLIYDIHLQCFFILFPLFWILLSYLCISLKYLGNEKSYVERRKGLSLIWTSPRNSRNILNTLSFLLISWTLKANFFRRGVLDTTLCDKVCQWFSLGCPVSSTNKTDCYNITEILLKVALNTITPFTSLICSHFAWI
jgi:hypothetical protein